MLWRLGFFLMGFAVLYWLSWRYAFRKGDESFVIYRRRINLLLMILNSLFTSGLVMLLAGSFTPSFEGVLPYLKIRGWQHALLGLLLMDLAIYWQHRLYHIIPFLWRLHRVHHSDPFFDLTTGLRFHPGEMLISLVYKSFVVSIFGISFAVVISFEIILNLASMFTHCNFQLPSTWDGWMRKVFVTPDFHRIHHTIYHDEMNANYGFCLSLWDYCFRSYVPEPRDGQKESLLGLRSFRSQQDQNLGQLLKQPFI